MLDINILKNSGYFKEIILEKWDILFKEWEIDYNIYIILIWELKVEKYTSKSKNETKTLAYLEKNDVFWEAALSDNLPKWVNISAKSKTMLLSINAKEWMDAFGEEYPTEAFKLLKYMIFLANKRLSEANYLITAAFKISSEIRALENISNKKVFEVIEKLKNAVDVDDIIYYEANPVMENFVTLKYDTRQKWVMQNEIKEITNTKLDLLDLKVDNFSNYTQQLSIWNNNLWFLIFLKKNDNYDESDKKVLFTTSAAVAWLIKQKQLLDEERDKEYMEE